MRWLALAAVLTLTACKKKDEPLDKTFSGCDPVDPSNCLYPFPSSYFLEDDASTATGKRVHFYPETMPIDRDGIQLDPTYHNEKDGFSPSSRLMFWFEGGTVDGAITWKKLQDYKKPDAKSVLIEASTGRRVPHFLEIDHTGSRPEQAPYILQPVEALKHGERYVVGIRDLTKIDGTPVAVSPAFKELRDDKKSDTWDVEGRRSHYEKNIFPVLAADGVQRGDLQLAWDFTVLSEQSSLGRMHWMRDDMYKRVGPKGPKYTIDSIEDNDCTVAGENIARTVYGTMKTPLYATADEPEAILTRDDDGMPYYNGDAKAEFLIRIPCSLESSPTDGFLLQYGHGLLGSKDEARTGWLSAFVNDVSWVVFAMDWVGMFEEDVGPIILYSASDPSKLVFLAERSMQGFTQKLAGMRAMLGDLGKDPVFEYHSDGSGPCMDADGKMDANTGDCMLVVNPDTRGYYGISQGAILGGALMALSDDLERGTLSVGAMNYSLMLNRSHDFDPYFLIFKEKFSDDRDIALFINGLLQMLWDPAESAGYAHTMGKDKDLLLQVGIGDNQVTTLGAHVAARAWDIPLLEKSYRPVFGLDTKKDGYKGSALVEWYYPDGATEPVHNVPPDGLDPHECVRREPEGQAQIVTFLETGVIEQTCKGGDGPCIAARAPSDADSRPCP